VAHHLATQALLERVSCHPVVSLRFVRSFDDNAAAAFLSNGRMQPTNELMIDGVPKLGSAGVFAYIASMDAGNMMIDLANATIELPTRGQSHPP
jgi:hypothetical protein